MLITLKEVTMEDVPLLFHLLKERPKKANISHRKMPSMKEHKIFIKTHPYFKWYVVVAFELGGSKNVGAIYLSRRDEIGVAILKKYQRKGYAGEALKEMINRNPRLRYYANIAPTNFASQRLFKNMEFTMLQYTLSYDRPDS